MFIAIFGGLFALAADGLALRALRDLPSVWRGERLPGLPRRFSTGFPEVNHRNFAAYTACMTGIAAMLTQLFVAWALGAIGVASGVLYRLSLFLAIASGLGGFLAMIAITAFGRPHWLIPPAHRTHPGALRRWWRARRDR